MEQRQGHAIQMEHGQTKNQPARVSFVNGERGTKIKVILQKREKKKKMKRKEQLIATKYDLIVSVD